MLRGHKSQCTACACRLIQLQLCIILRTSPNIHQYPSQPITIQPFNLTILSFFVHSCSPSLSMFASGALHSHKGNSAHLSRYCTSFGHEYGDTNQLRMSQRQGWHFSELQHRPNQRSQSSLCHPFVIPLSQPRISRCFSDGMRATNKLAAST